jgi:hypothetical protein
MQRFRCAVGMPLPLRICRPRHARQQREGDRPRAAGGVTGMAHEVRCGRCYQRNLAEGPCSGCGHDPQASQGCACASCVMLAAVLALRHANPADRLGADRWRAAMRQCVQGPDQLVSLDRITLGTFAGPAGTFRQCTEITSTQRAILAKLELADPPRIYQLTPAGPAS